ncbi:hypothetical protein M422DRAFT_247945, partial [Sphaerobolus stellatus SS14]
MRFTSAFISTAVCATLLVSTKARPYPAEELTLRQTTNGCGQPSGQSLGRASFSDASLIRPHHADAHPHRKYRIMQTVCVDPSRSIPRNQPLQLESGSKLYVKKTLPIETWTHIASYCTDGRDLSSFTLTCHLIRSATIHFLFRKLIFEDTNPRYTKDIMSYLRRLLHLRHRIEGLSNRPDLTRHIRHIEMRNWSSLLSLDYGHSNGFDDFDDESEARILGAYSWIYGRSFERVFEGEIRLLFDSIHQGIIKLANTTPLFQTLEILEGAIIGDEDEDDPQEFLPIAYQQYNSLAFNCSEPSNSTKAPTNYSARPTEYSYLTNKTVLKDYEFFVNVMEHCPSALHSVHLSSDALTYLRRPDTITPSRFSTLQKFWITIERRNSCQAVQRLVEDILTVSTGLRVLGVISTNAKLKLSIPKSALPQLHTLYAPFSMVPDICQDRTVTTLGLTDETVSDVGLKEIDEDYVSEHDSESDSEDDSNSDVENATRDSSIDNDGGIL